MSQEQAGVSPILERRRVEAKILGHVYQVLKASHGVAVGQKTIADAVRASSIEQASEMAADTDGGTSMETFVDLYELWTRGGALETAVHEQTETTYRFDVTRCQYAEMYREMGLEEIGHLLSCQRDGTFCEGYDKRLKMTRTQTIMQGGTHCDFSYRMEEGATGAGTPDDQAT